MVTSGCVTIIKDDTNLIGISIGGGAPMCPCLYIVQVDITLIKNQTNTSWIHKELKVWPSIRCYHFLGSDLLALLSALSLAFNSLKLILYRNRRKFVLYISLFFKVFDNTPAAREGTLEAGDELVGVNGVTVKGKVILASHWSILIT